MKVLVTGASGFIGSNLVAQLLGQGIAVRALYRRSNPPGLLDLARRYPALLELHQVDLTFPRSMPDQRVLRAAMGAAKAEQAPSLPEWPIHPEDAQAAAQLLQDCDHCVHIAAKVGDWGSWRDFFAANTNPTRILAKAAQAIGLQCFVYVSSLSVHGFGHHRSDTESGDYFRVANPYQLSKRCAESAILAEGARGLTYRIIRPGNVYGPGDTTTFYPLFDAMRRGIMGTLAGGRYLTCPVYIDDMVRAITAALGPVQGSGRVFNITAGETISWRQVVDLSCDALGIPRSRLNLPGFLARLAAWFLEGLFKLIHIRVAPPLTPYRVEQLLHDYDFSPQAAQSAFGYQAQTMFAQGIIACAQAYLAETAQKAAAHGTN